MYLKVRGKKPEFYINVMNLNKFCTFLWLNYSPGVCPRFFFTSSLFFKILLDFQEEKIACKIILRKLKKTNISHKKCKHEDL